MEKIQKTFSGTQPKLVDWAQAETSLGSIFFFFKTIIYTNERSPLLVGFKPRSSRKKRENQLL